MSQEPRTCSLSHEKLSGRVLAWSRVMARAIDRRVDGDNTVATYPRDDELLEEVRALIAAEAECCPFMEFTVTESPEGFTVELRVPATQS